MSFFSSLSTCLSWGLPSHSCRSPSQAATEIWTIDSGISYTGSIGILFKHWVNPSLDGWQTSSPCWKTGGTHRSRHSKAWI